jgi:quinol monooxygenase YgiN
MFYIFIRHKVSDYARWKRGVRAAAPFRKVNGELSFQAYRSSANPNDVTVVSGWANPAQARAFVKSAELRKRMKEVGVISQPQVQFFRKAEDLSVG